MMILRPWRALCFLGLILVLDPVGAWYKHVASPRYHTVGRASGLLMGVGRSPYLWRRALAEEPGQSPDVASSLRSNRAFAQWLKLQPDPAGVGARTTLEQPHLMSPQGPPEKGKAGKRAFLQEASLRRPAVRTFLAVLQHQGTTPASQCPAGCRETPRRKSALYPALLERAMQKKGPLGVALEARFSKPEIGSLPE